MRKQTAILNDLPLIGGLEKHRDWVESMKVQYTFTAETVTDILREEVGQIFARVLECAGVYKRTPEGRAAFLRFVEHINTHAVDL